VTDRRRRGRFKWNAGRWVRAALAAVLVAAIVLLAAYLVRRIGRTKEASPPREETLQTNVNVMENVQVIQFKGDRGKIEARGDRSVPAGEGLYCLEGNVEVVDYGRKGGREIRIRGDALTYDRDWVKFGFRGNIRVDFQSVHLEASEFVYDRTAETMITESGAAIRSDRFEGAARRMVFYTRDEEVLLQDEVRVAARILLSPEVPLVLTGQKFVFGFKRRSGTMEGNVEIVHGRSRGRADSAYLEEFLEKDDLKMVELSGGVQLHVEETAKRAAAAVRPIPAKPAAPPKAPAASLRTELRLGESLWQDVEASSVRLISYPDVPVIEKVQLRGAAIVHFYFRGGNATGIAGEAMELDFNRAGGLSALGADTQAWIETRGPDREILHSMQGSSVRFFGDTNILTVARSEKSKARLVSSSSEVLADQITVFVERDDFEAEGSVQMRSQSAAPAPGSAAPKGFFAPGRPVFCQSQTLRYSTATRRFSLTDPARPVRAWQDDKVLTAKEVTIVEDGAEVTASGAVQSVFPHRPPSGPPRRIEITADRMRYDQAADQVVYDGACVLKTGLALLRCGTITVDPAEQAGTVRSMRATQSQAGPVRIFMGLREATGELGVYDVEKDTITLTGRPVLREKDTGEVRGDKLTFYLSDGRIQVQERSETSIRS
jgi:lipopolysaccharide transport protein LptA